MSNRFSNWAMALAAVILAAGVQGACSGAATIPFGGDGGGTTSGTTSGISGVGGAGGTLVLTGGPGSSGTGGGSQSNGFDVTPVVTQTITVPLGKNKPTQSFKATLNGNPIGAGWGVDRGDIGAVPPGPSSTGVLTPTGTTGGIVTVKAALNKQTVAREVFVKLVGQQNGVDMSNPAEAAQVPSSASVLTAGGGVGGVGGEGLGPGVTDPPTLAALGAPGSNGSAEGLQLLYPYNGTVWPRGLLAPLLMWDWATGDADAIEIKLATTSGSFTWTGTFAKPAVLAGGPFVRHPIPQDVWEAATNTAGGSTPSGVPDQLMLSLTIAKGGLGYGPLTSTWTVAPAHLSGIIYYNTYGTQLAKNFTGAVGGDGTFGAAVLSIHVGDSAPQLVAGSNGGAAQCRVCHSVAASGARLVAQHGDNDPTSSAYTLSPNGAVEAVMAIGAEFPGMYPDGSMALSPAAQLLPLPDDSTPTPTTGLTSVATNLGTPAFSPDGTQVVFNPMSATIANPTQKLVVMGFDVKTSTFSNPVVVADDTGQPAATRPGWPAFFPDGKSVVFHHQSVAGADGNGSGAMYTRKGSLAQIAWTSTVGPQDVTALNELNGKDAAGNIYLPKLTSPPAMTCTGDGVQVGGMDADHSDDVDHNYEPTVNPVASGGYAWVVFTSRRMYGSVAHIPPFCSDPRGVDLVQNITPKKLWVAAIDLSAKAGTDASHPAFYLPGQELLAGNSRGFWVLDPCQPDGQACASGDECCNGYCEPAGDGGALVCSNTAPSGSCSGLEEKCATAADCCDPTNLCIDGFCTQAGPH